MFFVYILGSEVATNKHNYGLLSYKLCVTERKLKCASELKMCETQVRLGRAAPIKCSSYENVLQLVALLSIC